MSVAVETEGDAEQRRDAATDESHHDDIENEPDMEDTIAEDNEHRNEDLESRLAGGSPESVDSHESITREEKLLEEMLRLKLVGSGGGASAMLPPKQRIKLYQPRSKLEQFEDILIESQLLDQNLPELGGVGSPLDYEKFDLENLSLQDAINGITDYDSSDAIFAEPGQENPDDRPEVDQSSFNRDSSSRSGETEIRKSLELLFLQPPHIQALVSVSLVWRGLPWWRRWRRRHGSCSSAGWSSGRISRLFTGRRSS